MADIPIQLRHTQNLTPALIGSADTSSPSHLLIGEACFAIASPAGTKMWVGDTTSNRLLLSTVDTDDPIFTNRYLKLSGGQQLTGALTTTRSGTFANDEFVTKDFVDQAVAAGAGYRGTFDPSSAAEINAINDATKANGYYWMAEVAGTTPTPTPVLPGIAPGTAFNPGDQIVWNDTSSTFTKIAAGGLTQPDADARYLQLGASNLMTTGGSITMPTGYAPTGSQVATATYVGAQLGSYLPLIGGTLSGPLIINHSDGIDVNGRMVLSVGPRASPVGDNDVVRKQDVDAAMTRISGGTF